MNRVQIKTGTPPENPHQKVDVCAISSLPRLNEFVAVNGEEAERVRGGQVAGAVAVVWNVEVVSE